MSKKISKKLSKEKTSSIVMQGKKEYEMYKKYLKEQEKILKKYKDDNMLLDRLEELSQKIALKISSNDVIRMLMYKYLNKKEVVDVIFKEEMGYGYEYLKEQGDIEDIDLNEFIEDNFVPFYFSFRTNNSKVYKDFVSDLENLRDFGLIQQFWKDEKVKSSKKEFEGDIKITDTKYEAKGSKTKNAVAVYLKLTYDTEIKFF